VEKPEVSIKYLPAVVRQELLDPFGVHEFEMNEEEVQELEGSNKHEIFDGSDCIEDLSGG
jgi:hypothetical protein